MSKLKKAISLLLVCAFALAALWQALPVSASMALSLLLPQRPQSDREKLARKPKSTLTLKDKLGVDDGYGLVLFLSADVGGNLEVCGCPIHPLGGVARRMGYINALRQRSPDAATLMVDAGHIFSNERSEGKETLRDDAALMNDWMVKANEMIGMNVVNLSYLDIPYAKRNPLDVGKFGFRELNPLGKLETPAYLCANFQNFDSSFYGFSPIRYISETVTSKRLSKPVTIAFIGVTEPASEAEKAAIRSAGFFISDPYEAVSKALAEVKDKVDVTAVVGYFKPPVAYRLAMQNPDLDLILGADGSGLVADPKQVNNTLIMFAANQGKYLGELRFYTDKDGVVDRFTTRYVELDDAIPDDPQMLATTQQARREIDVVQRRVAEQIAVEYKARGEQASQWVTAEACATCHKTEYDIWKKSRHSHAFAGLTTKSREFDDSCVGCHSVGFKNQGFVNIRATPQFANVQCEACHGPGEQHVKAPKAGNYQTPAAPASCVTCHDPENSPDFVFAKYWPLVAHTNSLTEGKRQKAKGSKF